MSFLKYHLPLILYAGVIFFLSSLPKLPQPFPEFTFQDKIVHMAEFMIFGILIWHSAVKWRLNVSRGWLIFITIIIGIVYAASDEYHQAFVPGRYSSVFDWTADSIGLAAGISSAYYFTERKGISKPDV